MCDYPKPRIQDPGELDLILDRVFAWSKGQDFRGHNKHDGLNSPILRFFLGWGKWPRLVAIQAVMRSPVNIRPLLAAPKTVNPKGIALFVLGLLDRYAVDPDPRYLGEGLRLIELLFSVRSKGPWTGDCWGYPYPWQDPGFFAPPHTPNAVVTSFVCEALLAAYRVTGSDPLLTAVGSATDFFLKDLTVLENTAETMCLAYMPLPMSMRVMDVSILVGAVLAQYARITADNRKMAIAGRLIRYVVSKQTDDDAWFYTDPPGDSRIRHDNYHTGFILDALWRYMEASGDWQYLKNYENGLRFYAERLFEPDGAPRWMSDVSYPRDVHGSAQGLVSFALATQHGSPYAELLPQIGTWALANLYNPEGRFFYQKTRWYTKRFTLLRWCNAWMFRGLAAWRRTLARPPSPGRVR